MNNIVETQDQQIIDVGSIVFLRSDRGILGTVLEKMFEDDGAKYKILINGRILTLPESRIGLRRSTKDELVSNHLEDEQHIESRINEGFVNTQKHSTGLKNLSNNHFDTMRNILSTKTRFSFSNSILNQVDEYSLQFSDYKDNEPNENIIAPPLNEKKKLTGGIQSIPTGKPYDKSDPQTKVIAKSLDKTKGDLGSTETLSEKNQPSEGIKNPLIDQSEESFTEKVSWSTVIDGKRFRFAFFLSYIGLPIGCLLGLSLFVISFSYPSYLTVVYFLSMIISIIVYTGLYKFKHYAYLLLMISYFANMSINAILLLVFLGQNSSIYFIQILTMIPFLIYFYNREDAYKK